MADSRKVAYFLERIGSADCLSVTLVNSFLISDDNLFDLDATFNAHPKTKQKNKKTKNLVCLVV